MLTMYLIGTAPGSDVTVLRVATYVLLVPGAGVAGWWLRAMAWAAIPLACAAIWIGVDDAGWASFDPFSHGVYAVVLTIVHLSINLLVRVARRPDARG